MPHAELSYSSDLGVDAGEMLAVIEATIQRHDAGSGECKGRAYPTDFFHHSHMVVALSLLEKPHRDEAFTTALMADVERVIKSALPKSCFFSLELNYNSGAYVTNKHEVFT